MPLPLKKLSRAISDELGKKIQIISAQKVKAGFEYESFILTDNNKKKFFLRRVKSQGHFKYCSEQNIYWLSLSNKMMNFSPVSSDGLGVFVQNKEELKSLPTLNHDSKIFHLQHYEDIVGQDYWTILKKKNKKDSKNDLKETREIAELLCKIHKKPEKILSTDVENELYNQSLHSIFTAQDLFFFFLQSFGKRHPIFPQSKHGEYLSKMVTLFHSYKDNGIRLKHLHGDFWGANVFRRKDNSWSAVDYSRILWGESGIDIAFWMAQYLWLYHETKNKYFYELGEEFLKHYEKISGDKKIRYFCSLPLGLVGLIYISPYFYPERVGKDAKNFFAAVKKTLDSGKFCWK